MGHFFIGPSEEKAETLKARQNWSFYVQMECPLLWPTYTAEKGRTLGKTYEINVQCYWEHIENLGNINGNMWDHQK
jgi:hypothetical protein